MKLKINLNILNKLSILYLALPLLIFLGTWLKYYIGIISICLLLYAVYVSYFKDNNFKIFNFLNNRDIFWIILIISFLWCYFAGLGGFWYQSSDHNWRNAIFRDLINYSWPLYYKTMDVAMVYYIGFWLPSALVAKIFSSISTDLSFFIGNILLLLYSTFGVLLVFLNLVKAVKAKTYFKIIVSIIIFILFSGMDVIGVAYPIFFDNTIILKIFHFEWWARIAQYSSMTTVLFWVFNQGLVAWLATLMFFNNKNKIENYGLIAVLCFFCSPLPFAGLSVFIIIYYIKGLFVETSRKNIKTFLVKTFSVQNIISILLVTPIIFLYFTSNKATSGDGSFSCYFYINSIYIVLIIYFILLEVGFYFLLIYKQYRKNIIYYISLISLIFIPCVRIGEDLDFCMRASIPAIVILSLLIIKFILRKYNYKYHKIIYYFLCMFLLLGSITPFVEFSRGIKDVVKNKTIFRRADDLKTFEGNVGYDKNGNLHNGNFVAIYPKEKKFFKYLAKK